MQKKDNLHHFPIRGHQRWKNRVGKYGVPCMISNRWLQFPRKSSKMSDGEYLIVNVMTDAEENKTRKICELIIIKEDLIRVLSQIESE